MLSKARTKVTNNVIGRLAASKCRIYKPYGTEAGRINQNSSFLDVTEGKKGRESRSQL